MRLISTEGYDEILEVLDYDNENFCFYWKISPMSRVKAGDKAGCKDGRGYYCIRYREKLYPVHKLVWFKEYGFLPTKMFIDHINSDRGDNRVENLRLVDRYLNGLNRLRKDCDETKNYPNIYSEGDTYLVRIRYKKKVHVFGPFVTKSEAILQRDRFIEDTLNTWKDVVLEIEGVVIP